MIKRGIETLVGLFVLLGILALTFMALKAANLASFGQRDAYMLQARFEGARAGAQCGRHGGPRHQDPPGHQDLPRSGHDGDRSRPAVSERQLGQDPHQRLAESLRAKSDNGCSQAPA